MKKLRVALLLGCTVLLISCSNSENNSVGTSQPPVSIDSPTADAISQTEANTLIGLTEEEAGKIATENSWLVRVAMRDGEAYMLTTDYRTNRVNLTLVKTFVTAVTVG